MDEMQQGPVLTPSCNFVPQEKEGKEEEEEVNPWH
jgi:hypothetical protein